MIVAGPAGPRMPKEDDWDEMLPVLLQPVAERAVWPVFHALDQRRIGRLIVSPNRALHIFPLHACRLHDGRYLADACEVIYNPSLSILRATALCGTSMAAISFFWSRIRPAISCSLKQKERVSATLPDHTVCKGSQANKELLLGGSANCHVLHYSGHAVFDPLSGPYSQLTVGLRWHVV